MLRYTEEEIAQKLESTANATKADGQDRECIGFVLSHVEKVLRADNPPKEVMNLCMAAIRAAEAAAEPWQQSFAHDLGAAYCRELYRRSEEVKRLEAEVAHSADVTPNSRVPFGRKPDKGKRLRGSGTEALTTEYGTRRAETSGGGL